MRIDLATNAEFTAALQLKARDAGAVNVGMPVVGHKVQEVLGGLPQK